MIDYTSRLRAVFAPATGASALQAVRATMGALPMVARALLTRVPGKNVQIRVDPRATTGSTDCESYIRLPRMPLPSSEKDVDAAIDTAALMYGLLHHEVGHINESDIAVVKSCRSQIEATLTNILEDVRQENLTIKRMPVAKRYLDALNFVLAKEGKWARVPKDDESSQSALFAFLLCHVNAVYRRDESSMDVLPATEQAFDAVFGQDLRNDLETILQGTARMKDNADALALAREVLAFLRQQSQPQQPQQQPQQSQQTEASDGESEQGDVSEASQQSDTGDGEGEQGESEDDASQSDTGDDEGEQGESEDDASQSDTGDGEGEQDESEDDASQSDAGDGEGDQGESGSSGEPSLADKIREALGEQPNSSGDKHDAANELLQQVVEALVQVCREALDLEDTLEALAAAQAFTGGEGAPDDTLQTGQDHDLDAGYSASLGIRNRLVSYLDAVTNDETFICQRGRRLSDRHLANCVAGDNRIFRGKIEGVTLSTAVMLVQDVSGSMDGHPIKIASQALYATALALEGIEGVEVAAMAFPGNGKVLGFGESPRRNAERFQLDSWGGTPMAEGVLVATQALLDQRLNRRIMIVLTDGEPDRREQTLAAIASAEQEGIEVFGVGILTASVEHLFRRSTVITTLDELPDRLVSMVRDEIVQSIAA
ncbi:MAG: VWA domain-containing protein [Rhodanobacter sp.]|nr:VWA domain-containing protein [Rhodanobacter sp.]